MRKHFAILLSSLMLVTCSSAPAGDWGDLTGKVVIRFRTPPAPPKATEVRGQTLVDESLLVANDGGLVNAVLYVITPSIPVHPELAANVLPEVKMTLRNYGIQPRILPVWLGRQSVRFENRDAVGYNLNVQPPGDQAINPLLNPGDSAIFNPTREQRVPFTVGCNIHPWPRGYVLPRENPYVAVTDGHGAFRFTKLPAQELEFQLWHERFGFLDTPHEPQGRFTLKIRPGSNEMGPIVVQR